MTKFDEIQKAKHYNSHPSRVECKEIAKHLGFYLGNSTKYLWRMHEKHDDLLPDLKKAAFYVGEYISGVVEQKLAPVALPKIGPNNLFNEARKEYNENVRALIGAETDATAGIFWALVLQSPDNLNNVQTALTVINNRILTEDRAQSFADARHIRGPEDRA